jgi:adenylate cyclase
MSSGEWTFAFVDLAGFTALTEAHGDETAATQAVKFYELTRQALVGTSHLVKQIGDAVLIAADEPAEAVETVRSLMTAVEEEANFPLIRAGLHTGSAIRSVNDQNAPDYLGSGVNVAARVAGQATSRQILLTETVAKALDDAKWPLRHLGPTRFRNVPLPIELYELIVREVPGGDIDPVCRMHVAPGAVRASLRHADHEYVFCSLDCVAAFAANPDNYVPLLGGRGDD